MRLTRVYLSAVIMLASACASSQAAKDPNELRTVEPKRKKNPNVITKDELIDPAITSRDAYTAIRHLRPNFFVYHGPATPNDAAAGLTQISENYGPLRPVKDLAAMNTFTFVEVRYLNAEAATARFGLNANGGPVIVLVSNLDAQ
jgi:hypothetical protein